MQFPLHNNNPHVRIALYAQSQYYVIYLHIKFNIIIKNSYKLQHTYT